MCRLLSRIRLSFSFGVSRCESVDSVDCSQGIDAFLIGFLRRREHLQWKVFALHQQLKIHLDPDQRRWTSAKIKHRNNGTLKISFSLAVLFDDESLSLTHLIILSFRNSAWTNQRTKEEGEGVHRSSFSVHCLSISVTGESTGLPSFSCSQNKATLIWAMEKELNTMGVGREIRNQLEIQITPLTGHLTNKRRSKLFNL